jgi:hypothetical protein
MATAFRLTMMTCRACGKRFYVRAEPMEDAEDPSADPAPPKPAGREALDEYRRIARPSSFVAPVEPIPVRESEPVMPVDSEPVQSAPIEPLIEQPSEVGPQPMPMPMPIAMAMPPTPAPVTVIHAGESPLLDPEPELPGAPKEKARGFRVRLKIRLGRGGSSGRGASSLSAAS